MIRKISDIMTKDFIKVNWIDGVRKIKIIAHEKGLDYFPVIEDNKVVGIITDRELMQTHPNRIAADAMTNRFVFMNCDTAVWEVKESFKTGDVDVILVNNNNKLVGIVTQPILNAELGKHIDLLTGLYKSDYIYYKIIQLLKYSNEMSIIFIDIDNFGYINKKYGHICGNNILKEVVLILKKSRTEKMYLCRFGGDEFIILVPYYLEKSKVIADKILQIIAKHKFYDNIPVTVSAGICGKIKPKKEICNIYEVIIKLINTASLASTKAKKTNSGLSVVHDSEVDEIA